MKEKSLIDKYRAADVNGRLIIMFKNYARLPRELRKAEKIIIYKIKAEREYIRSHNRDTLSTRVQSSSISNPTENEAIDNALLEDAFNTGRIDERFLENIEEADAYREDIRIISIMRMDYDLLNEVIDGLDEKEIRIIKPYLSHEKTCYELADDEGLSYAGIKKRISKIRSEICDEMADCLGYMKIN